jgi:class 3 adenylate cyclase
MQRAVLSLPDPAERPQFRVGINSGPALVGNIGAADIRNFSAIGDTTNLAARLQTYAPVGSVVIGARTYELIRDIADVRSLGTPALKGKSEAVEVYELVGLRTIPAHLRSSIAKHPPVEAPEPRSLKSMVRRRRREPSLPPDPRR